ncbi:MAG: hypothetical protein ACT4OZ_06670 [Gemmatimonadota bacterium]
MLQVGGKLKRKERMGSSAELRVQTLQTFSDGDEQRHLCDQLAIDIYDVQLDYRNLLTLYEQTLLELFVLGLYDPLTGTFFNMDTQDVLALVSQGLEILLLRNQLNMMATFYSAYGCHAYHGNNSQ